MCDQEDPQVLAHHVLCDHRKLKTLNYFIRVSVFKYTELFIDSQVCQAESELLCQILGEHRGLGPPINTSLATPDKYLL